jgi:hypothetical protein
MASARIRMIAVLSIPGKLRELVGELRSRTSSLAT